MLQSEIVQFDQIIVMASGHGKLIDTISAWGPIHDAVIHYFKILASNHYRAARFFIAYYIDASEHQNWKAKRR